MSSTIDLSFITDEKVALKFQNIFSSSVRHWDIKAIDKNSIFICCLKYIARYQVDNPETFQQIKEYILNLLLSNKLKLDEILQTLFKLLNEKVVFKLKKLTCNRKIYAFNISWMSQKNDLLTIKLFYHVYNKDVISISRCIEEIEENDEKWSLNSRELKQILKEEKERNSGDCPICYSTVEKKKLFCGHSICQTCISNIIDNCCPFCRESIQTLDGFKIKKKIINCEVWVQPEEVIDFLPLINNLK